MFIKRQTYHVARCNKYKQPTMLQFKLMSLTGARMENTSSVAPDWLPSSLCRSTRCEDGAQSWTRPGRLQAAAVILDTASTTREPLTRQSQSFVGHQAHKPS